jgi:hypothetical protein
MSSSSFNTLLSSSGTVDADGLIVVSIIYKYFINDYLVMNIINCSNHLIILSSNSYCALRIIESTVSQLSKVESLKFNS